MAVGFQDFWVAGSRFFYKRDDIGGVDQPWIDLGVIEPANPTQTIEKLELEDSDGGVRTTVDEKVTKIDETYDITCSNMNLDNLSLLFLSNPPEDFTQTKEDESVVHTIVKGRLIKIHDDDTDKTNLFNLLSVAGVVSGTGAGVLSEETVTDIDASAKTITTSTDISTDLSNGEKIVVKGTGLVNSGNSRTYTVASVSTTVITVEETPAANETGITGTLVYAASADTGTVYDQDVDWEVASLQRGFIRILDAGAIATGDVTVLFTKAALTGKRLIKPQDFKGEIKGQGLIFWARGNFAEETVREARVSITPSSANIQVEEFSNFVLTVKVLSDITQTIPGGRMVGIVGTLPTVS